MRQPAGELLLKGRAAKEPAPHPQSSPAPWSAGADGTSLSWLPPFPAGLAQAYLAKDVFNVTSAQLVPLQVKVVRDVPVPGSDAAVLPLVTAAEGLVVRAKLEVQRGPERGPIIQALGVSLQQAHPAQQKCEMEAENTRRSREARDPPTPTTLGNGCSQHSGLGTFRLLCWLRWLPALPVPSLSPPSGFFPSFLLTKFTEVSSKQCPSMHWVAKCFR